MDFLGKWAEQFFALKCTEGNGRATPPDADVNGWDFLVEFPEKPHAGLLTDRPGVEFAFAQIKSTIGQAKACQIKLSNVLKACRQDTPWFVFLIVSDPKSGKKELYGLHVWRDHMAAGLKAVHQASVDGAQLHRRKMKVKFADSDKIEGDVIAWMSRKIAEQGDAYRNEKRSLANTLGYEDGHGFASLTVEGDQEEIALAVLGLKKSIRAKRFTFTPARFGIADKKPEIDESGGNVTFYPEPKGTAQLTIKGPPSDPSINLEAKVYTFGQADELESHARLRFSAAPVELVWAPVERKTKAHLAVEWFEPRGVAEMRTFAQLCAWAKTEPPKFEIWNDDKFLVNGKLKFASTSMIHEANFLLEACTALKQHAAEFPLYDVRISLEDLNAAAPALSWFGPLSRQQGTIRVEVPLPDLNPPDVRSFIYYLWITVGEWTFSCVVRRVVTEDVIINDARRITTGAPTVLDWFLAKGDQAGQRARVERAYRRRAQEFSAEEQILEFDDMIVWGKATQDALTAPSE